MGYYIQDNDSVFSHPGETLQELLDSYHMISDELAHKIGIDKHIICDILNGKAKITKNIAYKFATIFQLPQSFWVRLQTQYDKDMKKTIYKK